MDPIAQHTKLEAWDDEGKPFLQEYRGSGKLKGKACLVTGGDSGIGRAVAFAFVREGADVTITFLSQEREE
jgi:shikimate 5-dehydrogenase